MELNSMNGEFPVTQAHDFPGVSFCRFDQTGWKCLTLDDQRVVPGGLEWIRHVEEYPLSVMVNHAGFAVHQMRGTNYVAPKDLPYGLVAKANAKQGNGWPQCADEFTGDAGLGGSAGAWADQ